MKIILSRKGFDSGAGGCPSPIFPDGSMLSLPIPDKGSSMAYEDLLWQGRRLSDIMAPLAGARLKPSHHAHLDPDLVPETLPRHSDWRPVLGQTGSAQGHLRNEGVGPGDLFLFFGLFRKVDAQGRFIRAEPRRHVIWGWLQVDEVIQVDGHREVLAWAGQHPHVARDPDPSNTLYRARVDLSLPGCRCNGIPGAGVFPAFHERLQLSDPSAWKLSTWRLPAWFYPDGGRPALSYHRALWRWHPALDSVCLQAVGKGQEFVLNVDQYPECLPWLSELIS